MIAGRYRLNERVGTGGDGIVWRAVDEQLGRVVALKRALSEESDRGPERARLLRREAGILAQLDHPNIVSFFDLVVEGIEWWLVMEYVASRSLAEQGTLLPERAAHLGAQLAEALEVVHAAGVLHRDIKPGNVLVTEDDRAKLGDFGISRAVWADETLTDANGLFIGTPGYAAPELASGVADPSPASDVFSLGATLFAAVEGTSPFGVAENPKVLLRRAEQGIVAPTERAGALAPVLWALLRPEPAERPTVNQARRMLEDVAASRPVSAMARGGPHDAAGHRRARRWRPGGGGAGRPRGKLVLPRPAVRRRRTRQAIVGVAGVALVAGLLVYWPFGTTRHDRPPTPKPAIGLGEARTAEPCSLVDPATLASFGNATLATDYGNFDRCDVIIGSGRTEVDVEVQLSFAIPQEDKGPIEKVGPLNVVRKALDHGACDRTVIVPDGNRVFISAQQDGSKPPDLCGVADAATTKAVGVLSRGQIPRRATHPDPASLINANACGLLDGATLARFPGLDTRNPTPGFGSWECRWRSTTSPGMLLVIFDRNQPLDSHDGRETRLGGHQAFVQSNGYGEKTCLVSVVQRRFFDATRAPTEELLLVVVTSDQPAKPRCALATALAGPAASRLPKT